MRKTFALFIILFLIAGFIPAVSNATTTTTFNGLNYEILSDLPATAAVGNNGGVESTVTGDIIIPDYIEYSGINYNVSQINDHAFNSNLQITNVYIGNNVTNIGKSAFESCTGLVSIDIGNSVNQIDTSCFYGCNSLKTITFRSETPPAFGVTVFESCSALEDIYVPAGKAVEYAVALTGLIDINKIKEIPSLPEMGKSYEADMSINAEVEIYPTYSLTFPAAINFGKLINKKADDSDREKRIIFTIQAENVENVEEGSIVNVYIESDFTLTNNTDPTKKIPFNLYRYSDDAEINYANKKFFSFKHNSSEIGILKIDQSNLTKSGIYTGNLRFRISYEKE